MKLIILEKAHKYIKREGTPGNYIYWYPEDVNKPGFPGKEVPVEKPVVPAEPVTVERPVEPEKEAVTSIPEPVEEKRPEPPVEEKWKRLNLTQLKTNEEKVWYLTNLAQDANRKYFDGKLKIIRIDLLKDVGKVRRLGEYNPETGEIRITPRYFLNDSNKEELRITLIHELCHQAARQIDGQSPYKGNPHSYHWRHWMRKCGLPPEVVHKAGNIDLLTEEEKKRAQAKKEREEKAVIGSKPLRVYDLREKRVVKFNSDGKWILGVLAGPMKSDNRRWLMSVGGGRWWKIPIDRFFSATPEEEESLKNYVDSWYNEVKVDLAERQEMRGARRTFRRMGKILGRY